MTQNRHETEELRHTNHELLVRIKQLWTSYKAMLPPDLDRINGITTSSVSSSSVVDATATAVTLSDAINLFPRASASTTTAAARVTDYRPRMQYTDSQVLILIHHLIENSYDNSRKDLGALQTNVEYLTDRIINNNNNSNPSGDGGASNNYATSSAADQQNHQNLVSNSSNDFDNNNMEPQIANQMNPIDQSEGTLDSKRIC